MLTANLNLPVSARAVLRLFHCVQAFSPYTGGDCYQTHWNVAIEYTVVMIQSWDVLYQYK